MPKPPRGNETECIMNWTDSVQLTVIMQGDAIAGAGVVYGGAYVPAHIITPTIVTLVCEWTHLPVSLLLATLTAHLMAGF